MLDFKRFLAGFCLCLAVTAEFLPFWVHGKARQQLLRLDYNLLMEGKNRLWELDWLSAAWLRAASWIYRQLVAELFFILINRTQTAKSLQGFLQMPTLPPLSLFLPPGLSLLWACTSCCCRNQILSWESPPNCCWPAGMRVWEAKQNWSHTASPCTQTPKPSPVSTSTAEGHKMELVSAV